MTKHFTTLLFMACSLTCLSQLTFEPLLPPPPAPQIPGPPFEGVNSSSIAFADVDSDGYQDVLITGRNGSSQRIAKLYTNDGMGGYTEVVGTPFDGVDNGSITFADIDGDGDQDVLITGENSALQRIAKLYANDGMGGYTEVVSTPFEGIINSSIAFADIDGDGSQDVLITGQNSSSDLIAKLYANDGTGDFSEVAGTPFEGVNSSSIAFADVDSDGYQDVLITGQNSSSDRIAKLYTNDGTGVFSEVAGTPFDGVSISSIVFADIESDGDQDVLINGLNGSNQLVAKLYANDGIGGYTEVVSTPFEGVIFGSIAFSDIDGDGDQDVLITGSIDFFGLGTTALYNNDGMGGYTEVAGTLFEGVYNSSIAFADVDDDGDQDVLITGLNGALQRIAKLYANDGIGGYTEVTGKVFDEVERSSIAFEDIDGDGDQDVLITGSVGVGSGNIAKLYTNDGMGGFSEVAGTPFEGVSSGSIDFSDVDGDGDQDILITGGINSFGSPITKLYNNDGIGGYTEVIGTPFEAVSSGSIAFSDVDSDGDEDLLITGKNVAKLYTNDGIGIFSEVAGTPFEGVSNSSIAFSDVDNDGDQDVLITGFGSSQRIAKLYTNSSTGIFSEVVGTPFEGVSSGSVDFSDVDGDGDQDVLITGLDALSQPVAELYINEGGGSFSVLAGTPFEGVRQSSIAFSDVDVDGDQDVLITGFINSGQTIPITKLYTNDGTGVFSELTNTPFQAVGSSSVAFSDVDGDGDQDVLITGINSQNEPVAEGFRITPPDVTAPSFTSAATASLEENSTAVAYMATADETVTFTLGSTKDEALFALANANEISFTTSPDFESPLDGNTDNDYVVDVTATDEAGNATTLEVTITVTDADEIAPSFTSLSTASLEENSTAVAYMATADEAVTLTLGSTKDEALFSLANDDEISFTSSPDYESPMDGNTDNDYVIDVTATDAAGNATTLEVTITVTDVDDTAPSFTSASTSSLEENSTAVAYTATADETVTFTLGSTKDEALFSLANDDEISFTSSPDFESPLDGNTDNDYVIDITATDAAGNTTTLEVTITVTDVDDTAPSFTSLSTASLEENSTAVAYMATADETVTFTLGSTKDEALFSLANDDEISFTSSPDFESPLDGNTDNDYVIDITATDAAGNTTTLEVTITVTDVDDTAPSFTSLSTASLEENSTAVAYMATADETVTFTLGSTKDGALFSLANDDEISFTSSPDFESPMDGNTDNDYVIDVTATDAAGNATTLEVTITVTDADEIAPSFTSLSTASLEENSTAVAYMATADETVTFTLGSTKDEALFALANANEISFTTSPDFEEPQDADTDNAYLIDVIATDAAGNATTLEVAITVTDTDEIAPNFTSAATASLEENSTAVAYMATADETVTFTLGSTKDEALFALANANEISFTTSPDFEEPQDADTDNAYLIDVIATDAAGNTATLEVAITVTDTDEIAPNFTSAATASLEENSTAVAYTATADETVTFTLGSTKDEALFALANANEISFTTSPDFENPQDADTDNAYLIDVIATDASGNATTLEVTITVTDADEIAPSFTSAATASLEENSTAVAYTATANETVTFTLGSTKDEALFALANANEISFTTSPDFENPQDADTDNAYLIDVIATDASGNATTLEVTITVTDADEIAPSFTSAATASLEENSTAVAYTATANETVTFTLGSTKDEALFALANANEISFTTSPDFENPQDADTDNAYLIDVIATDASGNATTLEVTITITDVNDNAPVLLAIGNQSGDEGTEITFIAEATDADLLANTLIFSLDQVSLDKGMTIDEGTGSFSWTPGEDLDGDHEVTITVSDGNATDSETITITVNALPLSVAAVKESIFIYPNPAQDLLKVEIEGEAIFRIFNLNGMSLEGQSFVNEISIDIQDLKPGLYFLEMKRDGKTSIQKFVKVN